MCFPSVFLFCTKKKKKNDMVYMEKKENFVPILGQNYNFLHGLYGGKLFSNIFLSYTNKNQRNFYLH